jgi:uncharacterized protein involved in type VI secretion and phage assembly
MGIPVATITCGGQTLDPQVEIVEIEIRRELDRIPEATLSLLDGSVAKREFALSNGELFVPGKPVTIALRYEGDGEDVTLFDGLVVRHAVESQAESSMLRVELKDAAIKLTRQRKSAVFREQTDDAAIRAVIDAAGLEAGAFATADVSHPELIQYYASDWDFIVSRADVQSLAVDVHLGVVSLAKLELAGSAKRTLEYGLGDVHEFELELDGSQQWAELSSVAWDLPGQKLADETPATQPTIAVGNLDAGKITDIAKQLGGEKTTLLHPVPLTPGESAAWANARLLRSRLALLRGRVVVDGDPELAPLDTVEIVGVGERFDGFALVSAVTHKLDHEGWKTELQLGLSADWFSRRPDIAEVPAGGMLPPLSHLQIAKVAPFEADPLGEHRIKLVLPALADDQGFIWARLARPDAGKDRGSACWPEPEDEVVVGFLGGDPRQAVVLGALYGSVATPPAFVGGPSDKNQKRAFVSKSGARVSFDDEKIIVSVETPGGNKIEIDDDQKSIRIADQHGNEITLSDKGITLKSASDFNIDAAGKVVIKGSAVDVQ